MGACCSYHNYYYYVVDVLGRINHIWCHCRISHDLYDICRTRQLAKRLIYAQVMTGFAFVIVNIVAFLSGAFCQTRVPVSSISRVLPCFLYERRALFCSNNVLTLVTFRRAIFENLGNHPMALTIACKYADQQMVASVSYYPISTRVG